MRRGELTWSGRSVAQNRSKSFRLLLAFADVRLSMPVSSSEEPLLGGRVAESLWTCSKHPTQHLVHEVDDSPCTRELERRLSTHSEDLQEELRRHQQVQVDLGRAEGVGLSLCNKWPRGETATKFPSMGGLNFSFRQKRHKLRSYQSIHL